MTDEPTAKARALAGVIGVISLGVLGVAVAFGDAQSFVRSGPFVILVGTAILFEFLSRPLSHYGYISLAFFAYFTTVARPEVLVAGDQSLNALGLLSQALLVAAVAILPRVVLGAQQSFLHRATYFSTNVLRVAAVGGAFVGIQSMGERFFDWTTALAAGGAAVVYVLFDRLVVNLLMAEIEDEQDDRTWQVVLRRAGLLLTSQIALALLAIGFALSAVEQIGPTKALVIGLGLSALLAIVLRSALWSAVEELMVQDQEQLELKLRTAEHHNKTLKDSNEGLSSDLEKKGSELDNVYEMARQLGASTRLADTVGIVHSMIRRLRVPYQSCVIFLLRENAQLYPALSDTPYKDVLDMSPLLQLEETLIKEVMEDHRPKLVAEMSSSSEQRIFKDERSVMCVPLIVSKEIIGVIYVGSVRTHTHKEEHLDTLKMLSSFAAPSIKSAMLFEDKEQDLRSERAIREAVEAKNRQLGGLQKMGQQIGASLDAKNTMRVVADSLGQMVPNAQSVIIFTEDLEKDKNALKADHAESPYADYVKTLPVRKDEGLLGKAIELNSTLLVQDTQVYDLHNLLAYERSVIVAPLTVGTGSEAEEMGCLYVGAAKENAFTEEHRNLVETVSYQAAMAIKNARLYEQTQKMALTDGLTGLYTHRLFQVRLSDEIDWSERHGKPFVLVMVDADGFKTYNDTLGHPMGDALLKEVAALLKDKVRNTDIVCRYGGDEFAIILRETEKDKARVTCERIREAFQLRFGGNEVPVTASIGMGCFPSDATNKKDLAKAADDALYVSKRNGRNQVNAAPSIEEKKKGNIPDIKQEPIPR